jgi:hypothetical protein
MTCYERLRNYFNAIDKDKVKEYHEEHGRKKDKKYLRREENV